MKKSDGEIHDKDSILGHFAVRMAKKMWTAIIAVTLPFRYRMGFFSVTRHDRGRDIFVRRLIISSHNICTDYRNH